MAMLHETAVDVARPRAGVSWAAVFAGAVVATGVTVMLTALGTGIGFAWISPQGGGNPSPVAFTVTAAIWLIIVQWIASFFGGYLAGRLRPASASDLHGDERMFRDTATGFTAWAVSVLLVLGLALSGIGSVLGSFGKAADGFMAQSGSSGTAMTAVTPSGYMLDKLFRPDRSSAQTSSPAAKAEAGRILAMNAGGTPDQQDHNYLVQLVEAQTGLATADATARVDAAFADEQHMVEQAKKAVNVARKAASYFSLYTFFSMLVGAFIACVAGAIGGRQRDR